MSNLPELSVIIVNYNGKDFISDCIDSVLRTDYPDFKIVVVDNGSTDSSFQLLKNKYKNKIKLIRSKKNLYFTGGCNLGAKSATGDKLVFLNPDTEVNKHWLMNLVKCHLCKGEKSLVQPKILFFTNKDIIDNVGGKYIFPGFGVGMGRGEKDVRQYNKVIEVNYVNGTCFLIDKNFFKKLGGFDNDFKLVYEDVDLNLRAKKAGGKAYYCPKSVIYHKGGLTMKSQIESSFLLYHIRKNRLMTLIKNASLKYLLIALSVYLFSQIILFIKEFFIELRPKIAFTTFQAVLWNIKNSSLNWNKRKK